MRLRNRSRGLTLVELMISMGMISVLGLAVYSMLNAGMILGAKNTAVNTAHQQARIAMLQMLQDLHSSVSLPQLVDVNGVPLPTPAASPSPVPSQKAEGIAFSLYASGPMAVKNDADPGDTSIVINANGVPKPTVGQRLIIRSHKIEATIKRVTGSGSSTQLDLMDDLTGANYPLPVALRPSKGKIACFTADRCSYIVVNGALQWTGPTTKKTFAVMGNYITNKTPFATPKSPAGSPFYRFVAAIDLSTADAQYSNRGFKSANILLNGLVPMRARLTDTQ